MSFSNLKRIVFFLSKVIFFCEVASVNAQPIEITSVELLSDGTKIHATIYKPTEVVGKLPAIAMAHGWGGEASYLASPARRFAEAGFFVLVFDYRGWGKSDSRLVQKKNVTTGNYEMVAYKGLVDPLDQAEDYFSVVNWLATDHRVDSARIGLWGTSWSGGTVVYVAARDSRVKALVSQASPVGWAGDADTMKRFLVTGGERARGIRGYPKPFKKEIGNLRGGMVYERLARFNPREDAANISQCATLFLVAEFEELFDNQKTALVAHNRIPGISKYVILKGASHYSVYYGEVAKKAGTEAVTWFLEHL